MADTKGYVTLRGIVSDVMNEMGDYRPQQRKRLTQLAIRGITEMSIYDAKTTKVAYLNMDVNNIVYLPEDFIDYTIVGVVINGRIWTLSLNDRVPRDYDEYCGVPVSELRTVSSDELPTLTYAISPHYYQGIYQDTLYALGGGYNDAYFRVDYRDRIIYFDGIVPRTQVVLEYVSSGVSLDGETYISLQAREMLIAWVQWKRIANMDGVPENKVQARMADFHRAEEKYRISQNAMTADEILDIFYESWHQGLHR